MTTKGIRGAITIDNDDENSIKEAVLELLGKIIEQNEIKTADVSHAIFTVTKDIKSAFPAKFARKNFGWDNVAMMCYNEMDVTNSLPMCIRVLIVVNCTPEFEPEFVYLKNASNLRK